MQEPPKSFTEWFDGIGVVPKVWCSPRLGCFCYGEVVNLKQKAEKSQKMLEIEGHDIFLNQSYLYFDSFLGKHMSVL